MHKFPISRKSSYTKELLHRFILQIPSNGPLTIIPANPILYYTYYRTHCIVKAGPEHVYVVKTPIDLQIINFWRGPELKKVVTRSGSEHL